MKAPTAYRSFATWLVISILGLCLLVGTTYAMWPYLTPTPPAPSQAVTSPTAKPSVLPNPAGNPGSPSPSPSPSVSLASLQASLNKVAQPEGQLAWVIADTETGQVLAARQPERLLIPASTQKLLTGIAVLTEIDPNYRFTTSVKYDSGKLVLVGGGDVTLVKKQPEIPAADNPASLDELAKTTAAWLKQRKIQKVRLDYDAKLFSGPSWHPRWPQKYRDQVAPIQALMVNKGKLDQGGFSSDPAKLAATEFGTLLAAQGISVTPSYRSVSASGKTIAQVRSAPIKFAVERMILRSDNTYAEMLLRHLALARKLPGSFEGGVGALRQSLARYGMHINYHQIFDGSGLSRDNRLRADELDQALDLITHQPELTWIIDTLPIAGETGSLKHRFWREKAKVAHGLVHAKSGYLTGVITLAGTATTSSGRNVRFTLMSNGLKSNEAGIIWSEDMSLAIVQANY